MKRVVVSVLVLMVVLAASVFSSGSGEGGAPKPVTLMFAMKNTTSPAAFEEIFALYKETSGNSVELQPLSTGEDYGALMMTRFATKDYPDLFEMDPGTKQYYKFRAEETLYDWTDSPVSRRMTASMREFQTLDGKIYGINVSL